jgi:hypothetical protein
MNTPFFFFGSLRDPLILEAVLGRDLSHLKFADAWAPDFRTERAAGYSFPLLRPALGNRAPGLLTWGLTAEDQARITYFEDSEYALAAGTVETSAGPCRAQFYDASGKLGSSGELWDLAAFQRDDKPLLLAVTRYVMTEHYGVTPQNVMEEVWSSIRDRIAREMGLAIEA